MSRAIATWSPLRRTLLSCATRRLPTPRIAAAVVSRPLLCSINTHSSLAHSCFRPPTLRLLNAREPTALKTAIVRSDDAPIAFVIRSPLDIFRLIARVFWLGLVMLPPLLVFLPAYFIGGHGWLRLLEKTILRALERGGPCLIKLGQWASTRPDLLPLTTCRTLASLHDAVPSHSHRATLAAIEEAFGAPWDKIFKRVSANPVGSGCIAQVHEGVTIHGERVAIKVLHPHVNRLVAMDVYLLKAFTRFVESWLPIKGLKWLALSESVDSFAIFMSQQLDLRREARNLERFRSNFIGGREDELMGRGESNVVSFPRPLLAEGLVSSGVLVESFLDGQVLSKMLVEGRKTKTKTEAWEEYLDRKYGKEWQSYATEDEKDRIARARRKLIPIPSGELGEIGLGHARDKELARRGVEAFFAMVLKHNFVHADLHPGNILVALPSSDNSSDNYKKDGPLQVGIVDAGLAIELSERDRANFKKLFRALGTGDGKLAGRLMLENATEQDCDDPKGFEEGVEKIVKGVGLGARGAFNLKQLKIGDVLLDLTTLVRLHRVKVEPNFTTLVMAIVVLEGLGRQLDPNLDLFAVAVPMLF